MQAGRKHTRTGDDYRAVVTRPGPAPTGRAREDYVSPKDVSYQPDEREQRFLERLSRLNVSNISRAETECIIRRTLKGYASTPLSERKTIADEAKKFGITVHIH